MGFSNFLILHNFDGVTNMQKQSVIPFGAVHIVKSSLLYAGQDMSNAILPSQVKGLSCRSPPW